MLYPKTPGEDPAGGSESLSGLVDAMTTRAQRTAALERWADEVDTDQLVEAKTAALRTIAELVEQRDDVDSALPNAIRDARDAGRSWSEIGAMWGCLQASCLSASTPSSSRPNTPRLGD